MRCVGGQNLGSEGRIREGQTEGVRRSDRVTESEAFICYLVFASCTSIIYTIYIMY